LIKWPVPILSATRMEWLPQVHSDLFLVQTPVHLPAPELDELVKLIRTGQPIALLGSAAGGIDPQLAALAGLRGDFNAGPVEVLPCRGQTRAPGFAAGSESEFNSFCYPQHIEASASAQVVYEAAGVPQLTLADTDGKRVMVWNPPDLRSTEGQPLSWIWGNTGTPYALAAGAVNQLLKQQACLHAEAIDLKQTVNIAAWRTADGDFRILAGNLEEGLRDDADLSRHAVVEVPARWGVTQWKDLWTGQDVSTHGLALPVDLPQAASMLMEGSR
jgi:hypothetical protein